MVKRISLFIIMLTVLSLIIPLNTTFAEGATMQVAPPASTVVVGTTFTVNVTVTNVTDLAVWEIQLYYLNTILNCTNVTEGPFLEKDGHTQFFASLINNKYNATHGWILAGSTLMGNVTGVNGSGTLATITFQAIAAGDTPLHLTGTTLKDSTPPPRHPIPHTATDGTVHVTGAHDLAGTAVTPLKTIIGQTYTGEINVTTQNQGSYTESFNLTLYANTTVIATIKNIILENKASKTVTFTWNTIGFAKGNYTIWAYAEPVAGETDTEDNTYIDGTVLVTIPGDVNGDRKVDGKDIALAIKNYGKYW
jgi:hypothetical protein